MPGADCVAVVGGSALAGWQWPVDVPVLAARGVASIAPSVWQGDAPDRSRGAIAVANGPAAGIRHRYLPMVAASLPIVGRGPALPERLLGSCIAAAPGWRKTAVAGEYSVHTVVAQHPPRRVARCRGGARNGKPVQTAGPAGASNQRTGPHFLIGRRECRAKERYG